MEPTEVILEVIQTICHGTTTTVWFNSGAVAGQRKVFAIGCLRLNLIFKVLRGSGEFDLPDRASTLGEKIQNKDGVRRAVEVVESEDYRMQTR